MTRMSQTLRLPRWNEILIAIYRSEEHARYCEQLNRLVRGSRNYLRAVVAKLARHGLIRIQPGRKINHLALTDKGERVAHHILNIRSELGLAWQSHIGQNDRY